MGKFKTFVGKVPPIRIGFSTIHPTDDSDKMLGVPSKPTEHVGFVTIHPQDDSDRALKPIKEDIEPSHVGPFHQAVMDKPASKYGESEDRRLIDSKEFHHHHELNIDHQEHHAGIRIAPIREYTATSSGLNSALIEQHKLHSQGINHKLEPHHQEHHDHLRAETNHPGNALHKPTVVHSGVGERMGEVLQKTKVGDHVHFPAYTSTSTMQAKARTFAGATHNTSKDDNGIAHNHFHMHVAHFHLPQGYTKGRHIANISEHHHEHEMLLHHGQTFRKVEEQSTREKQDSYHTSHEHHHHFVPVEE